MKRGFGSAVLLLGVLFSGSVLAQTFSVKRLSDDEPVLSGELSVETPDFVSQIPVQVADFSELNEPGEYYLDVDGVGRSVSFRIGKDVYDGELANVMLGFYGWRSGVDIDFERYGVTFSHAAGHTQDGLLDYVDGQKGVHKDGTGGWYDAGDYGKYLPTAAESVVTLLAAWEMFGDRLEYLSLPYLPEHGSALPDYLQEVKWELDWLLKMTYDDGSGRVHHKLNSPSFPGFVLPSDDPTTRYFSEYSTAATAELVAALAKAARVFAPYDDVTDGYSKTLLDAAQLSYGYLQKHPDDAQYDASVLKAGGYQKEDSGDRLWAAAELWETTGDAAVLADYEAQQYPAEILSTNFDWDQTRHFGVMTYALSEREGRDPAKLERARLAIHNAAQDILIDHDGSGYGRAYGSYYWGTNGVTARTCMLLHAAQRLEPDQRYLDACSDQIAYLYGRNQYNRSYVTGAGIDPPLHPHHRISGSDDVEEPYPGLLVGGGQTATNWKDQQSDFSSNEVAINWNSALAFALAGFIQGKGAAESLGRAPVHAEACQVRVSSVGYVPEQNKVATIQAQCELGSTFMCDLPQTTLSGNTSGPVSLIDDLEDGDTQISTAQGRSGAWSTFDDGTQGMHSEPELSKGGAQGSKHALCIHGGGYSDWGGAMTLNLNAPMSPRSIYDASAYTGISFWARGSATQFRALVVDRYSDPALMLCSGCYDHFQAPFTPTDEWQQYRFSWKELKQQGFGDMQPNICPASLLALNFEWPENADFELCLDDVAFTTAGDDSETPTTNEPATPSPHVTAGGGCNCQTLPAAPSSAVPAVALLLALGWRRRRAVDRA